jgi:microcystin-dependent protein
MQPYVATKIWKDGFGEGGTRITAADLTRIESGISAATQGVTNVETSISSLRTEVTRRLDETQTSAVNAAHALLPVGAITMFAGSNAPIGWVTCNGQLLDRNTYAKLFQVLGTSYGNTSATNFRVPDLRDRFPVGAGNSYAIGAAGGTATVTLSVNQIPAHTHDVTGKAGDAQRNGVGLYASNVGAGSLWQILSTSEIGSVSGLVTKPTGQGAPHENRPPYMAFTFIIKAQ